MIRPATTVSRTLSQLTEFLGISLPSHSPDLLITGICSDSREIEPGDLFIALPGLRSHGCAFLKTAVERGARAVLTDQQGDEIASSIYGASSNSIPRLVVPKPRSICGPISSWFYDHPSRSLFLAGITGTNGKTTTTYLLEQIWEYARHKSGLIGTIAIRFADREIVATHTTPESDELQRILAAMRETGARSVAMEVSSHALSQERVNGIHFSVVGFTNLTQDHLDYHGDMESYYRAKRSLFTHEYAEKSIISIDSEYGRRLWNETEINKISISTTGRADWQIERLIEDQDGCEISIRGPGGVAIESRFNLIGRHNLENLLLAVACSFESGVDPLVISSALPHLVGAPGRLERVQGPGYSALIDYAHTPDAVARVLNTVKERSVGRVIALLGCGGDRDTSKRRAMGRALNEGADIPIFTSDNPRSEDPNEIIKEMIDGLQLKSSAEIIVDRRAAIKRALEIARPGDLVLILGKGHEAGQEIKGEILPFSDRDELHQVIRGRS